MPVLMMAHLVYQRDYYCSVCCTLIFSIICKKDSFIQVKHIRIA